MDLRENLQKNAGEMKKHLDLDTFGEIMDDFIRKSHVALLVEKEADSEEWTCRGVGCGAVMDFYVLLNALQPIFLQMLEEIGHQLDAEKLADALTGELKKSLISAAEENGKGGS